jgi:hypothetical protein
MTPTQVLSMVEAVRLVREKGQLEIERAMIAAGWKKTLKKSEGRYRTTAIVYWLDPLTKRRRCGTARGIFLDRLRKGVVRAGLCEGCGLAALGLSGRHRKDCPA